jgi:hypothetical protein
MAEYASLREKIAAEKIERQARYARFAEVYAQADRCGQAAVEDIVPTPMVVVERANPLDDSSPIVRQYAPIESGVCGFAWVTVRPANSSFALWAKKEHGWSRSYHGGLQLWVRGYGQSMERKEAYARAFAAHIRSELGLECHASSRMD